MEIQPYSCEANFLLSCALCTVAFVLKKVSSRIFLHLTSHPLDSLQVLFLYGEVGQQEDVVLSEGWALTF